jgi:hypothetical protein
MSETAWGCGGKKHTQMEQITIFLGMVAAPAIILTAIAVILNRVEKDLDRMIWDQEEELLYFDDVDTNKV